MRSNSYLLFGLFLLSISLNLVALPQQKEIIIKSDELEYHYNKSIVYYKKNIQVKGSEFTINCDEIEAKLAKANHQKEPFEYVKMNGNKLTLKSKNKIISGKKALYQSKTNSIIISDEVQIQDGKNYLEAENAIYELDSGNIIIGKTAQPTSNKEKRVKVLISE